MLIFTYKKIMNMSIWLKSKLSETGITQAELSRRSGVSQGHITKVLNGDRGLGEQALKGIAEAFNIPLEEVFRVAGILPEVPESTSKEEKLLHMFRQMNEKQQQDILDYSDFTLSK